VKQILLVGCVLYSVLGFGCSVLAADEAPVGEAPQPGVILRFIGHDCFLLTTQTGARILMDPYGNAGNDHPSGLGLVPVDLAPDAVTVSHEHYDHNNIGCAPGAEQVLLTAGTFQVGDVAVTGYAWREGSPYGSSAMVNVIFVLEAAGTKIVHLGDSGVVTDSDILAAISDADVVIVNIDGYVIPSGRILAFMNDIRARTVIVAHYTVRALSPFGNAPTVETYFSRLPENVVRVVSPDSSLAVTPGMPTQFLALTPLALIK
jgi:L-ascorbate metabolism protein UlaG (beta-lactamase superfamily)